MRCWKKWGVKSMVIIVGEPVVEFLESDGLVAPSLIDVKGDEPLDIPILEPTMDLGEDQVVEEETFEDYLRDIIENPRIFLV